MLSEVLVLEYILMYSTACVMAILLCSLHNDDVDNDFLKFIFIWTIFFPKFLSGCNFTDQAWIVAWPTIVLSCWLFSIIWVVGIYISDWFQVDFVMEILSKLVNRQVCLVEHEVSLSC